MTVTDHTPDTIDAEAAASADDQATEAEQVVVEDVLVEEISIDGMCGVY